MAKVRQWYDNTKLTQAANDIQPSRAGFMNRLAFATYSAITEKKSRKYAVQLKDPTVKPPKSYNQAGNMDTPCFEAKSKEQKGMLRFNTWTHIPQQQVTPLMRQRALRAHYICSVKRNGTAKARVVVIGRRQHSATFSNTASPVASQLKLRLLLAISAVRSYSMS